MAAAGCLALAWSLLAEPAATADGGRLGVLPVQIAGEASADLPEVAAEHLRAGLSSFQLVDATTDPSCAEAACLKDAAAGAGAAVLVRVTLSAESRDYSVHVQLIDGATGEVLRDDDVSCEICTKEEAIERLDQELVNLRQPILDALSRPEEVPMARLRIASRPSDAVVRVDGQVVGSTPFAGEVAPGAHEVVIGRDGYRAETRQVELVADEEQAFEVQLGRGTGSVRLKWILGWSAVGLAVPLVATGIALIALDERPHKGSCHGDMVDANGTCEFRYNTLAGGVVALVGGIAAAGAGTTLLVLDRRERGRVEAWIGPGGGGLRGRF